MESPAVFCKESHQCSVVLCRMRYDTICSRNYSEFSSFCMITQEVLSRAFKIGGESLKVSQPQGLQGGQMWGLERRLPWGREVCLQVCLKKTETELAMIQGPAWRITQRHERFLELNCDRECCAAGFCFSGRLYLWVADSEIGLAWQREAGLFVFGCF